MPTRRAVLSAAGAMVVGPGLWARVLSAASAESSSFIDDLLAPDENGLRLPTGFRSRLIARSGDPVGASGTRWHDAPDGGGVVATDDGGWIYVSNAEVGEGGGGATALVFDRRGEVADAHTILSGTSRNCAGGMTPWGTWLSCEEFRRGQVHECDPLGESEARVRPALGAFSHEAAVVDAVSGDVYLTEDAPDGRLYRFVPATPGDLSEGELFAARLPLDSASVEVGRPAAVTWVSVSPTEPERSGSTTSFDGGEGAWVDGERLLFTTKGDVRVWSLDLARSELRVLHDCIARPDTPLDAVDNIVVHQGSGDVYVAEDGGNMQLCVLRERDGGVRIEAFLQVVGQDRSEITGPAFSPDGQRLYFSSQRGIDGRGLTYEVTGPFPRPSIGVAPSEPLQRATRVSLDVSDV